MKKSLVATLLVALLASSMVFAGFGGNVTASFGWDIDGKTVGFDNNNAPEIELTLNETAGEKKGEGAVYAEIKANLVVKLSKVTGVKATTTKGDSLEVNAEIKDLSAKVIGEKWYVGITGVMKPADFAKSYHLKDGKDAYWNWELTTIKTAGIEVGAFDFKAGVGFNKSYAEKGEKDNGTYFTVITPDFKPIEGLVAQGGLTLAVKDTKFENFQFGFGGKVGYASDAVTANVATDMGYEVTATKGVFKSEVAADAKYDFVSANLYYSSDVVAKKAEDANKVSKATKNLLNAKLAADFKSFELPLNVSVEIIDAINDARNINASVGYTIIEGLKAGLTFNTTLVKNVEWGIKGNVEYTQDQFGTFKADVEYKSENTLAFTASVENTKLINGATLALAYSGNKINLKDTKASTIGKVVASCKIAF